MTNGYGNNKIVTIWIVLCIFTGAFPFLTGCSTPKVTKWEYYVYAVRADGALERKGDEAFNSAEVHFDVVTLDSLGKWGWELVDISLEIETAFPNFGNNEYHVGIKTNVRPRKATLIFKRQCLPYYVRENKILSSVKDTLENSKGNN